MSDEENFQDNANGQEGSSSSEVKNDVKPETHFADEKGVPYYNRFRELSEKYKDVDLDLYQRAKDFDLDEAEEALQFKQQIYSDPKKLERVMQALKEEQSDNRQQGKKNPELDAIIQELNGIKSRLERQDKESWMKQYDSSLERSLEEGIKGEFKELGQLSELDKKMVIKFVDDIYQADAQKGPKSKLSVEDVPSVVKSVLKMVLDDRKGKLGGMIKKDNSPESLNGNGTSGREKPKAMSESERMESMKEFMRNQEAGKIPTS